MRAQQLKEPVGRAHGASNSSPGLAARNDSSPSKIRTKARCTCSWEYDGCRAAIPCRQIMWADSVMSMAICTLSAPDKDRRNVVRNRSASRLVSERPDIVPTIQRRVLALSVDMGLHGKLNENLKALHCVAAPFTMHE